MIKTFIVYWTLSVLTPAACPDRPKPDKFGRMPEIFSACAVLHYTTSKVKGKRSFMTMDSAKSFIDEAKAQEDVSDIRIDSVFTHNLSLLIK